MKTATEAKLNSEAETPTVKPATVGTKEPLVTVMIDREMTDGGIRVNGKLYVGNVKVSQEQADDLLRIQEEYFETKKKLMDKYSTVRMKSDFQREALFLADPKQNEGKKNFTRDYGLLGALEWSYLKPQFKEYLLESRKAMFGY